jgi:hypothetical protein
MLPDFNRPVRAHAIVTGELVWASNFAHAAFCMIFAHLVDAQDWRVGTAIWNALRSDSTQRDVLMALSEVVLKPKDFKRVKWAVETAGKLSKTRNDAVHAPVVFMATSKGLGLTPDHHSTPKPRRDRLLGSPNMHRDFRTAKGDLIAIGSYATAILSKLIIGSSMPWPERPLIRSKLRS